MSDSPIADQIRAIQARVTMAQVQRLAEALQEILPPEKDTRDMLTYALQDGSSPPECARRLLGSAYDWFAYGN